MGLLSKVMAMIDNILWRRRLHWVEISLARAWSHDLPPRLFDLDKL